MVFGTYLLQALHLSASRADVAVGNAVLSSVLDSVLKLAPASGDTAQEPPEEAHPQGHYSKKTEGLLTLCSNYSSSRLWPYGCAFTHPLSPLLRSFLLRLGGGERTAGGLPAQPHFRVQGCMCGLHGHC